METPVCPYCGSKDVRLDATAAWDNQNQKWELCSTYDAAWCSDCEEDIKSLKWIQSEDEQSPRGEPM